MKGEGGTVVEIIGEKCYLKFIFICLGFQLAVN